MIFFKLGWREITKHPGRSVLTLLSIVIGVAAVMAVTLTTQTTRRAFDDIYQSIAGRASLEVAGPLGTTFDDAILKEVSAIPGVKAAAPLMQRRSIIFVGKKRVQLVTMGIDPQLDQAIHDFKVVAGRPLGGAPGVLLHENFAKSVGAKPDDIMEILTRRGLIKTQVLGLYKTEGTATTGQGAVLLMTLRASQGAFNSPGKLDAIELVARSGCERSDRQVGDRQAAARKCHRASADGPQRHGRANVALDRDGFEVLPGSFRCCLALFVIINTFMINVTQRRRQLGIMRAIGATRGQIRRLVL